MFGGMSLTNPIPRGTREVIVTTTSGQTTFGPIEWLLYDAADIEIWRATEETDVPELVDPAGVSVAPASPAATFPAFFTVTLASALPAGTLLTIRGVRVPERSTDVTRAGVLQSQSLERELDKITAVGQELRRDVGRVSADYLGAAELANSIRTSPPYTLLANIGDETAPMLPHDLSTLLDEMIGSARGSLVARGAAGWTAVPAGSNGQVLRTVVAGSVKSLDWFDPPGGGDMIAEIYDPAEIAGNAFSGLPVADRTALAETSNEVNSAVLMEAGRVGVFKWMAEDLSAQVATDPKGGVYIAPASSPSGDEGAWVRQFEGGLVPQWFGAVGDGVADDRSAVLAAAALGPILMTAGAQYRFASDATLSTPIVRQPGSALIADNGATVTLAGALVAERGDRMFKGNGSFDLDYRNTEIDLSLFADSATDYSAAAQRALNAGAVSLVVSEEGVIFSGPTVVIPNGGRITITFRVSVVYFAALGAASPHFSYTRPPVSGGTLLTIRGQNYTLAMEVGGGKTSNFLNFNGRAQTTGMSITRSGTTATCTLASHGYTTGETAYIYGADQSAYNGAFTVTVVDANTFTYAVSGSPASPATGTLWTYGRESGVPWSDNSFVLQDLEFRGFYNVVSSAYASGNKIEKLISRGNNITVAMGRGTAFTEFVDWLDVGSGAALRLVDPVPNGLTNGIRLEKVYAVLNNGGVSAVTISGVESVVGDGNSVDICTAGDYCVEISYCTSVDLGFTWMASDLGAASMHRGMLINDVYRSDIRVLNVVNQYVGIEVVATKDTSAPRHCRLELGTFKGVTAAGILGNAARGISVGDGVRFVDTMPRTSSNYEMYFTGGTDYWSFGRIIMNAPSYTLPSSGSNSQAPSVMFV